MIVSARVVAVNVFPKTHKEVASVADILHCDGGRTKVGSHGEVSSTSSEKNGCANPVERLLTGWEHVIQMVNLGSCGADSMEVPGTIENSLGLVMPHAVTPIALAIISAVTAHNQSEPRTVMCASAFGGLTSSALFAMTPPRNIDTATTAVVAFMVTI